MGQPDNLRFLRRLVTALTATMILGVLTVIVLLVIRLQAPAPLSFPEGIALPDGVQATGLTLTDSHILVLTASEVLIYGADGQKILARHPLP